MSGANGVTPKEPTRCSDCIGHPFGRGLGVASETSYNVGMEDEVARVLIPRSRIAERIRELGETISRDLDSLRSGDEPCEFVLVPVLTGSIIFVADLIRHLPQKISIRVVTVSSYPGSSTVSQGAAISGTIPDDLRDKHVLIVDDILDSGRTIRLLQREIDDRKPRSLRTCVLLRKEVESAMNTPCDYVGFDIPNEFVVGYGLDYNDHYRNLPDIGVLKPDAMRDPPEPSAGRTP